jgi:signal transduction histidine kinase
MKMRISEVFSLFSSTGEKNECSTNQTIGINQFGDRVTPTRLTERDVRFINADLRYPILARWFSVFFYVSSTFTFLSGIALCLILIKSLIALILICAILLAANIAVLDVVYISHKNFKKMHEEKEQEKRIALCRILTRCNTPVLFGELDLATRFNKASAILVSHFSDGCYIDFSHQSSLSIGAICHRDKAKENGIKYIREKYPPNEMHPIIQVFKTGIPKIINNIKYENFAYDDGHLNLLNMYYFKCILCVPIKQANDIYGTITVGRDSERFFTQEDLEFLMEFANHAAIAICHTLKFEEAKKAIQSRDDFISIASHELRSPVGVVYMLLQTILRSISSGKDEASPKIQEKLNVALNRTKSLITLLDRLLDCSKIQEGKIELEYEEINFSEFLQETIVKFNESFTSTRPNLNVNIEQNIRIRADRLRLGQIIQNLLSNAVKYAGNDIIEISLMENENKCDMIVKDHGPGIAPDKLQSIFNRFERAHQTDKTEGLGLGLWICKTIIDQMGGKIEANSQLGIGSKFLVEFDRSTISYNRSPSAN